MYKALVLSLLLTGCTVGAKAKWKDTLLTLQTIAMSTRVAVDRMCDGVAPERSTPCQQAKTIAGKSLTSAQLTIGTTVDGLSTIESSSGLSGALVVASKAIATAQSIVTTWTQR